MTQQEAPNPERVQEENFYKPTVFPITTLGKLRRKIMTPEALTDVDVFEALVDSYATLEQEDILDSLEPDEKPFPWSESTSEQEAGDQVFGNVSFFFEQLSS